MGDIKMSDWIGTPPSKTIKDSAAFVYLIHNKLNNRSYIGYKTYWTTKKLPALKGRSKVDKKRISKQGEKRTRAKPNKRLVKVQSDWLDYWSSCEELKADVEKYGEHNFDRIILSSHRTKMEAQYVELKLQLSHGVIESDLWYNGHVRGRFSKYVLMGCCLNKNEARNNN